MFFLKALPTRKVLLDYKKRFPVMDLEAVESALDLLRRASVLERKLELYFSAQNLSQLRFLILIVIDREKEKNGLKFSEIAKRLDVARPVMTRTIQALETMEVVAVSEDRSDKRAKIVFLTEYGRALLQKVLPGYYGIIHDFMKKSVHHQGVPDRTIGPSG